MKEVKNISWDVITDINPDVLKTKNHNYLLWDLIGNTKIFLGIEHSTNNKCFMFLSKRDLYANKELPVTEGLEVRADFFKNDENKDGVLLKLIKDDYFEVFTTLINDLLAHVVHTTNEESFVECFFTRLAVWKLFLKNSGNKGLSHEKRRGLFGELYFLNEFLIPHLGVESLITWVGPDQSSHDVQLGSVAVEVKTSGGTKSQKIHISSERQLDDDGFENLFVFHLSLSARKNFHPSLVDIVDSIRTKFSKNVGLRVKFDNLLLSSGYSDMHKDFYLLEGYHVEEANIFEVKDGFPRIIGKSIMPGIGGIKYTVDVSSIEDFKFDVDNFKKVIKDSYEQ